MKDGLRFVDSDMHIMEPPDLFERYLDPKFRHRVLGPIGADGKPKRGTSAQTIIDGLPGTGDADMQQHRKRLKAGGTQSTQPLSGSRLADTGRLDFAIKRNYDPEAQVMGMAMEGVDIAVLYPTNGLSILGRNDMDPELSLAHLPGLQQLDRRVLPLQPGAPEVRRDAADARRQPRLPRAGARRARAGRHRLVRPAQPGQRPLLALQLLGSALHASTKT